MIDHFQRKSNAGSLILSKNEFNLFLMEDFSNEVIANIKSANDEEELIRVIGNSMSQLRKQRKSFDESRYLLHMIVCLRATDTNELPPATANNIKLATAIFRQFQKERREAIF